VTGVAHIIKKHKLYWLKKKKKNRLWRS